MDSPPPAERLTATVSGRVQGVGYRAFVRERARALNLTGWVRNDYDGSVSLEAEGPRENLERLLDDLRTGPRMARVDHVLHRWSPATDEFSTFSVRH